MNFKLVTGRLSRRLKDFNRGNLNLPNEISTVTVLYINSKSSTQSQSTTGFINREEGSIEPIYQEKPGCRIVGMDKCIRSSTVIITDDDKRSPNQEIFIITVVSENTEDADLISLDVASMIFEINSSRG